MIRSFRNKAERRIARVAHRRALDLRGRESVVSFTFDDVPRSACTDGARIIEDAGGRATYYVCGGFAGSGPGEGSFVPEDLLRLHAAGHEIGSHGFAHLDFQKSAFADVVDDLDRNERFFRECGLPPPTQFAFPFGSVNTRVKRYCSDRFASSRGVRSTLNRLTADLGLLKAVQFYDCTMTEARMEELMEAAREPGSWLIFLSHGVSDHRGRLDCSPAQLLHATRKARALGLPMLTMSQALRHFGAPEHAARPAPPPAGRAGLAAFPEEGFEATARSMRSGSR